mmetsp:Transcript_33637/g.54163  ORF Transcript_33637/g.54163 Transcript_33637/m.54163 type:complete len:92 (+) Transcript_33637:261-536(+)
MVDDRHIYMDNNHLCGMPPHQNHPTIAITNFFNGQQTCVHTLLDITDFLQPNASMTISQDERPTCVHKRPVHNSNNPRKELPANSRIFSVT